MRLAGGAEVPWQDRVHFYAVCAQVMRRILIDRARSAGPSSAAAMSARALADWQGAVPARDEELLALDQALDRLAKVDPRMGRVVELRYFAGLSVDETSEALGVSSKTVQRDWQVARNWLLRELEGRDSDEVSRCRGPHDDDRLSALLRISRDALERDGADRAAYLDAACGATGAAPRVET